VSNLADRQTDRQTDKRTDRPKTNPPSLGGGNKDGSSVFVLNIHRPQVCCLKCCTVTRRRKITQVILARHLAAP